MDAFALVFSRFAHVTGMVFWIGGVVIAGVTVAWAGEAHRVEAGKAARKAVLLIATPGMLVSWIAGLAMLTTHWSDIYARAGWMHAKLTLALVATALTGLITGRLRRVAAGDVKKARALGPIATTIAVLATLAIMFVFVRPF